MEAFFNSVKGVTATETAGILPEHFSGYFATLYRKHLDNVKDLNAFLDEGAVSYWKMWSQMSPVLNGQIVTVNTGPPPDPAKLHFDLKSRFNDKAKPGAQYTVVFPPEQLPSNTQGVFWIVEEPNKPTRTFAMHHYSCLVHSEIPGLHKVHVEFHGTGDQIKVVSNTVEMTFPTPQKP